MHIAYLHICTKKCSRGNVISSSYIWMGAPECIEFHDLEHLFPFCVELYSSVKNGIKKMYILEKPEPNYNDFAIWILNGEIWNDKKKFLWIFHATDSMCVYRHHEKKWFFLQSCDNDAFFVCPLLRQYSISRSVA